MGIYLADGSDNTKLSAAVARQAVAAATSAGYSRIYLIDVHIVVVPVIETAIMLSSQ